MFQNVLLSDAQKSAKSEESRKSKNPELMIFWILQIELIFEHHLIEHFETSRHRRNMVDTAFES